MKASALMNAFSGAHFSRQGSRIFSCFIWSSVLCSLSAFCTAAEVSFSIFVNARTSSRLESAPGRGHGLSRQLVTSRWLFHGVNHAPDAAAAGYVNEGEAVAHEIVTHVHDIIFREENDGVAVGVAGGKMQGANVFSVQVYRHVVLESDDGQRRLSPRVSRPS